MKISIITICYNEEKNIAKTIESVLGQTSTDYEYVICDGESTDGTLKIIQSYAEKFKDKGVDFIVSSGKDGGIYPAMNKGIELTKGDYVLFTNAGDRLYNKTVIEDLVKEITDKKPDVVYGRCLFVDRCVGNILQGDHTKLSEYMSIFHPATLVRSDVIKENKFNTEFKIAGDYNMMLDLYCKGCEFYKTELVISQFEMDGVSSTNRVASTKEAGKAKLNHGYSYDEEQEMKAVLETERKKRKIPRFIRKFYNKTIKKRLWIED